MAAAMVAGWAAPVLADRDMPPKTAEIEISPSDWEAFRKGWWVDSDPEWDRPELEDTGSFSLDAEVGHMLTDRLGLWSRPALSGDSEDRIEEWGLRFGVRYRFN